MKPIRVRVREAPLGLGLGLGGARKCQSAALSVVQVRRVAAIEEAEREAMMTDLLVVQAARACVCCQ